MPHSSLNDEIRYRLLKYLEQNPDASQRDLARELGMSVGKANYCLKELMRKGWIKVRNFTNSKNKAAYLYILTARGIEEKVAVTASFLRCKRHEYDMLQREIERLTAEVEGSAQAVGDSRQ